MKALRIILTQNNANYKKEETTLNKMTYPLPPFSTVIGAIHNACEYESYHPMDVSIQGKYESMHRKQYTDHCFLNSLNDDRGILVKMKNNSLLSTAFEKVAEAKASQGNSFRKGKTIEVINEELLQEYRDLKDLSDEIAEFKKRRIDPVLKDIRLRKKKLTQKKKKFQKGTEKYELINQRIKEIRRLEKTIKERYKEYKVNNFEKPYSKFANLTTAPKFYEILNNIKLILHIRSDEQTLLDIKENIYNLKSIGRSEDFVNIEEVVLVELKDDLEGDVEELISDYGSYLDYELIKNDIIYLRCSSASGTKYLLNKNYKIEDNKRVFEKKKAVYASEYSAEVGADNLFFDMDGEQAYIVNFF